jgi:oxygen-dependent protoporphyrinogen oxidase
MPTVVVVGGGISGLALAYRLEQRLPAADVIVLEERPRLGGSIDTIERDGFRVEAGPNGFLDTKPATLTLCNDLGVSDRLVAASESAARNRYLFLDGRLRLLPDGLFSFLRSDLLSWPGKVRLLAECFRPARKGPGEESVDAFARRRAGAEVASTLVDAFVTGIYAGDPRLLSAPASFPCLVGWERQHGSVMSGLAHSARQRRAEGRRASRMWSFPGGLRVLVEAARDRLRRPPLAGVGVRSVRRVGPGWRVLGPGSESWSADCVALTCPAYRQAELLADLDGTLAEQINGIPYNRVAVVALGYRAADVPHSLDGFGYLSPQRARRDVLGVQWCSSIFPGRAPAGLVLLRALCGGWQRPEVVDWDDGRLLPAVRAELRQALRIDSPPVFHQVVRWHRAIPQYHLGHLDRVAWIESRAAAHPGLFLGGNCYRGVALGDCVEQGDVLAERIGAWLDRFGIV